MENPTTKYNLNLFAAALKRQALKAGLTATNAIALT